MQGQIKRKREEMGKGGGSVHFFGAVLSIPLRLAIGNH